MAHKEGNAPSSGTVLRRKKLDSGCSWSPSRALSPPTRCCVAPQTSRPHTPTPHTALAPHHTGTINSSFDRAARHHLRSASFGQRKGCVAPCGTCGDVSRSVSCTPGNFERVRDTVWGLVARERATPLPTSSRGSYTPPRSSNMIVTQRVPFTVHVSCLSGCGRRHKSRVLGVVN